MNRSWILATISTLAVVAALSASFVPSAEAGTGAVTGTKRVAVLLINFTDNRSQPWTQDQLQELFFAPEESVASFYRDSSYDQLALMGDVFGWYTIPHTDDVCAYEAWATAADAQATSAGVLIGQFDYKVYAFPRGTPCTWGGLGDLPGTRSWLNGGFDNLLDVGTAAHELGHNFGLGHANGWKCAENGVRVTLSALWADCTTVEYGDPFSVMGTSRYQHLHHNWDRFDLGWLTDVGYVSLGTTGTFTLTASELPAQPGSRRLLRVHRGGG